MKANIIISTMVLSLCFISCKEDGGGLSARAQKNKEVNNAIMKAYESGDFSKMGDYIAADAIDHGGDNGDVKGLDSIVAQMKKYHSMMPDMKSEIQRELADDEYVFTWARMNGTMNGVKTNMTSMDVTKFKDGKAIEHWVYMDPNELIKMMAPPPPPPAQMAEAADSVKK